MCIWFIFVEYDETKTNMYDMFIEVFEVQA